MLARNNTGYTFNGIANGEIGDYSDRDVERFGLEPAEAPALPLPLPEAPPAAPSPAPKVPAKTAAAILRAESEGDLDRYLEDTGRPHVQAAARARLEELEADHGPNAD